MAAGTVIPEADGISYMDMYNAERRKLCMIAHLHTDGGKSLTVWKDQMEAQGAAVLYVPASGQYTGEDTYVFGFVSVWQ